MGTFMVGPTTRSFTVLGNSISDEIKMGLPMTDAITAHLFVRLTRGAVNGDKNASGTVLKNGQLTGSGA